MVPPSARAMGLAAALVVVSCGTPEGASRGTREDPGAQLREAKRSDYERRPRARRREPRARREHPGERQRDQGRRARARAGAPGDARDRWRHDRGCVRGKSLDVWLLVIDTPETVHPSEPVQCFGRAASEYTTRHLEGERIRLAYDVERRDHYERTLAYVFLPGGSLFNETLVARGYAYAYTYPPNIRHSELFVQLEREAREDNRGLWSGETCNGAVTLSIGTAGR